MNNSKNILLIDVGNTNILIGIYCKNNKKITSFRFTTNKKITIDEFAVFIEFAVKNSNVKIIADALIASVVPEINETIYLCILKYFKIVANFVNHKIVDIKINYKNPDEIGADRLVNAVAGIKFYGAPLMIVDIGTATTIDFINKKSEYIGGAILAGIGTTILALSQVTSKLPRIEFKGIQNLIGMDTKESIQSGIYNGFLGSIDYFKKRYIMQEKLNNLKVVLTGGYTEIFKKETNIFDYADIDLTIKGLTMIYDSLTNTKNLIK